MNPKTTLLSQSEAASAAVASSQGSLYQKLILNAFGKMRAGLLNLELPDGTRLQFGAREEAQWHARTAAPAALAIPEIATIKIVHPRFFERAVLFGDIGFAEAYMDGDWETPSISGVIAWFILNIDHAPTLSGSRMKNFGLNLLRTANRLYHLARPNSAVRATRNIREHYDLSNDFFRLWLDPTMMYSSARWESPDATLEEAQNTKNEALCRKLRLTAKDHVLEIGSGWGGWSVHAAKTRGCRITTLTLSQAQYELARKRIAEEGLTQLIEVRLQDYRALPAGEHYDKLVSIEMLEAVGHRYLPDWCATVARVLKPEGLLALQYITCPEARYEQLRSGVDFIQKHIFPGSLLLSTNRLNQLLAKAGGFVLHSLEDLGQDYARTLRLWRDTYNQRSEDVKALGFDARFMRKWNYYLAYCEAAFALRNISVVQTVLTRPNNLAFR